MGGNRDGRLAGMARWLEGSAFADGGVPAVLYHGTDIHDPFNVFTRWEGESSIGFHFGTREVANARIDEIFRMAAPDEREGIIIPVICRARNPLRLPDLMLWGQWECARALLEAGVLRSEEEMDHVADSCSEDAIFAAIEEAGYDCVVYGNECEHKAEVTDSVIVWRSELLKSPWAASFDPADPRLLPQAPTDPADMDDWERRALSISAAREELRDLRAALGASRDSRAP